MHLHKLRAKGAEIRQNKGACSGIVPVLKNFNATSKYVNQGGKRPGSIAVYLSVDHPDIMDFLNLKKNHGDEDERCRDLFYGLWIPDLFMERVRDNKMWSLFCPSKCGKLIDKYGDDYNKLYLKYESLQLYEKQVEAQKVWFAICTSQIETGTPYLLYKDSVNEKSNQKNVGVIKSSNLCVEIVEYTAPNEIAVCNLASISLPSFVKDDTFDFQDLHNICKIVTKNLNKIIDRNFYPVPEAEYSNLRHRPIGIGVQGLADVYMMLGLPFDSNEASDLNCKIFETMYHASLSTSNELALKYGSYSTFKNSPASKGLLQFDLWGQSSCINGSIYDWNALKQKIMEHGLRNSLLLAPMPTASTSQILGNNECFEPYTSNLYIRRTSSGEFVIINKHLMKYLDKHNLWNEDIKNNIILNNGSVQNIEGIPEYIKNIYKTAWEIKQKTLIDQAAERGKYICQSQSLNLFVQSPTFSKLSSMHFYGWNKGLKSGIYYLRTKPVAEPIKVTIDPAKIKQHFIDNNKQDEKHECLMCSG